MNFVYKDVLLVSFVMAISEIFKQLGVNKKFIPIINVAVGIALGVFYLNPTDIRLGIFQGAVLGVTACGAYSTGKNVYEGIK